MAPHNKDEKRKEKVAEKNYEPSDYNKDSQLSSGLATTHEQVSDTLTEGTIDQKKEENEEKDMP